MSQTSINRLETEPIGRLLLSYSVPAIANMTIISLYNICSGIFIGHGVGPLGITGLAVTFPFMNLVFAITMLVAIGGATVCSIALGEKNYERASMVLGHNIVLSITLSIVFSVSCLFWLDPLLIIFGASAETLPYAHDYMRVILYGLPIGATMVALSHLMRASGYPKKSLLMSVLSVGVNLVLTPVFIFLLDTGMKGAAMATIIAQLTSLSAMMFHYFNKNSTVHFKRGIFRLRWLLVKPMLGIGLAPSLMNICGCVLIVILNQSLKSYGGDLAIGAYGIVNRLVMLYGMIVVGLTQGMQPIIGYNFGARHMDRVWGVLVKGIVAASIITSSGFLLFQLAPGVLARMFTDHPDMIDMAVTGLRLCTMMFFLVGSQIVITAYFQSMGQAKLSIFLSLARQMLFLLPILVILPKFLGLEGVWLSLPCADVLATAITILALRYVHKNNRNMEL